MHGCLCAWREVSSLLAGPDGFEESDSLAEGDLRLRISAKQIEQIEQQISAKQLGRHVTAEQFEHIEQIEQQISAKPRISAEQVEQHISAEQAEQHTSAKQLEHLHDREFEAPRDIVKAPQDIVEAPSLP